MLKISGVDISTAVPEEKIRQNIVDARTYCVKPISLLDDWREGRSIAVIGGGPSLSSYLKEIKGYVNAIACGSVHDYLIKNRVYPSHTLICDPDPIMGDYLREYSNSKYLIASQCDKSVFQLLSNRDCYIWNSVGPHEFNQEMFGGYENCIPGGCTVGTRAILCAIGMGYKKIHLYGMDSCLDEKDNHHCYPFENPKLEDIGPITEIRLDAPSNKTFKVAGYMMAQVFDFQKILEQYAGVLEIEVFGNGVLAEIMRLGRLKAQELKKDI